jgi:hypothetical protein
MRCSCLKVAHSKELKSSLKNKIKEWILRREERAQELNLRSVFRFMWVGNRLRGRWEPIYSTHIRESHWEIFHWTSPVDLSGIRWKLSRSRLGTEQVWSTGQVRWRHLEFDWSLWNPVSNQTSSVDWTSLVPPPDKSGGAFWSLAKSL